MKIVVATDRSQTARQAVAWAAEHAERSGGELLDWFVDPARAPGGAAIYELEHSDEWKRALRDLSEKKP